MNVTTLGKILVYCNLGFSLILATWAAGIVTHRLDWAPTPEVSEGEHARKLAEIQGVRDNAIRFYGRWKAAENVLTGEEKRRAENQQWYAEQFRIMETGKAGGRPVADAVKSLAYKANGELETTKDGRPVLKDTPLDRRLPARAVANERLGRLNNDIKKEIEEDQKLLQKHQELTFELQGDAGKKGLQALLEESEQAQKHSQEELTHAKEEAIKGRVESGSLQQRQRQLLARLEELKKISVAFRRP